MLESPFLLIRAALPRHVRARLRPGHQHLERARAARLAVQVGLRRGQARPRGPLEGHRARGRRRTASPPTASTPATCARPSSRSRSPTRRSVHGIPEDEVVAEDHAHRDARSSASSSRPRSRASLAGSRAPTPAWSPARATRWTADGARDEPRHRPRRRRSPAARSAGGQWRADAAGTPVLAVHGITATHRSWGLVAERCPTRG